MSVIQAANWFNTQQQATLLNPLSRGYLVELLSDPVTALAAVTAYRRLRLANALDVAKLLTVTANYTELLARLPINWQSALERSFLTQVLVDAYASYAAALLPRLWLRLRETTGTVVANSGATAAGTFTPGAGAVGQTGQLGANEAYRWDGADSKISVPASALINNLTDFTWAVLCNLATAGESGGGIILTDAGANRTITIVSGTPFRLSFSVWHTSDASVATSSAGAQNPAANAWTWIFATYTAADKTCRLYVGRSGAVAILTATTTVSVNVLANGSGAALVGNNNGSTRTIDGLIDEALIFPAVLTTAQMTQLVQLTGV